MENSYDFIAIGDTVTDAFIRLEDASVNCDVNKEKCKLCLKFGDKVPYEFVEVVRAVGNSANAAVAAARLGLRSALVSNLGDDQNGSECLTALQRNKVSTEFIKTHEHKDTNYHYVLWFDDDRTILVKHQQYEYSLPDIGKPKWLYLSSLAENTLNYHLEILSYLEKNPEVKLAFQPGTFQMKLGVEKLSGLYKRSDLFFCNVEEAKRILGIIEEINIKELLKKMHALGPKIISITDGPRGAYVYDGSNGWFMPPYPDEKPPYERTGAGDSFASTFTSALALGMEIPDALRWGPVNSMSVVQHVGAQKGLLSQNEINALLERAPSSYKADKII